MGLIRKTMSVSTLGGVKYTSRREAQTKQAIAEARLANAQAEAVRNQAAEPVRNVDPGAPWWQQPTLAGMIGSFRSRR